MVGQIIGAAAQIGSSIFGAIKSSQANKRATEMIQNQRAENKKWYDQKMAEDYMQRSDVQNVLRKQRELLQEQYQRARATNIVAGGTDESLALQQQAANEAMGDTMADIAANASAYKDSVEQQYRDQDAALNQQMIGVEQGNAQAIAQAAAQVGSAVGGLMTGAVGGAKAKSSSSSPESSSSSPLGNGTTIIASDPNPWETEAQKYKDAFTSSPVRPINA
jgi:hypothetical protein